MVLIGLLIHHVPAGFQLGPPGDSIFDLCHISEVGSVWDAQTPHAVGMTPLSKVPLEGLGTS
ncbi:hypothetical protein VULLAG_LOCUS19058 [Vulpes lagopus]